MSLLAGTRLGPYQIRALLGSGGMGEVYKARDTKLGREAALKVLPRELAADPARRERLLREARAAAALNHPNICVIHEIGAADGQDYIAFEYIAGETLDAVLARGPLARDRLLELALPLAEALDFAHRKGVIHRDLKPSNVMISELGLPKILDFGLAKVREPAAGLSDAATRTRLTDAGVVLGTTGFMSPEQALGKEVDARSDVFAFGSLLYELATGRPAFGGATTTEVLAAVVHKEPVPVERVRPELPPGLGQVVAKALRKEPAERYQSMADLAADLRHLKRQSGQAVEVARPFVASSRRLLRSLPLAVAAAVVIVILGAAALILRWQGPTVAPAPGSVAVMYFENLAE